MPTEFFEKEGEILPDYQEDYNHELIYSTYQYLGPGLKLDGLVGIITHRSDLIEVERGVGSIETFADNPLYGGEINGYLLETPEGIGKLVVTYHKIPEHERDFIQAITTSEKKEVARRIHHLLHNTFLRFNDYEGFDVFLEDDTPDLVDYGIILSMIQQYEKDIQDYSKRLKSSSN